MQGEPRGDSLPVVMGQSGGPPHYDVQQRDAPIHLIGDGGKRPSHAVEVRFTNEHGRAAEGCCAAAVAGGPSAPIWMQDPSWMYLPHLQRRQDVPQPLELHHDDGDQWGNRQLVAQPRSSATASPCGDRILGGRQDSVCTIATEPVISPTASRRGPASLADAPIRGRSTSPGLGTLPAHRHAASRRSARSERQRQDADADQYVLNAALASHEERVRRRRLAEPERALGPRPADRLAALRRRVAARTSGGAVGAADAAPLLAEPANAAAVHHAAASSAWHDVALTSLGPSGP